MSKDRPRNDRPRTAHPRTWGFRLSWTDVGVLVFAAMAAAVIWPYSDLLGGLVLMVVGHFFLFCNVVRLHRNLELTWAGVLVLNAAFWWVWQGDLRWLPVLANQLPMTAVLCAVWMRHPGYHGIFARWLNPRLDEYLHPPGPSTAE